MPRTYSRTKRGSRKAKAIAQLKGYINPDGTRRESSIEQKVRKFLDQRGIPYVQEFMLTHDGKSRFYDFLISDGVNYFLLTETDGDYFHAVAYQEGKKQYSKLTRLQRKNLRNDKFKNELAAKMGFPLMRFTEHEIKNNFSAVVHRILQEINRQKSRQISNFP